MADFDDGFATYYAQRFWALLPEVYRTDDTDASGAPGPLQELLEQLFALGRILGPGIDAGRPFGGHELIELLAARRRIRLRAAILREPFVGRGKPRPAR